MVFLLLLCMTSCVWAGEASLMQAATYYKCAREKYSYKGSGVYWFLNNNGKENETMLYGVVDPVGPYAEEIAKQVITEAKFFSASDFQDTSKIAQSLFNTPPTLLKDKAKLCHSGASLAIAAICSHKLHVVSGLRMVVLHYDKEGNCKKSLFPKATDFLNYDIGMSQGITSKNNSESHYTAEWHESDIVILASAGLMHRYEVNMQNDGSQLRIANIYKIVKESTSFQKTCENLIECITKKKEWSEKDKQSLIPSENTIMIIKHSSCVK